MGAILLAGEEFPEAEPQPLASYDGLKQRFNKIPAGDRHRLNETAAQLVQLYTATATALPAKAGEWKKKMADPQCALTLVKFHSVSQISIMPISLDQIVEETREMPGEVVAELIDRIMAARHGGVEPSVAIAWKTEIDRRILEIESGKVEGIPLEESLARARNRWSVRHLLHPEADEEFAGAIRYNW